MRESQKVSYAGFDKVVMEDFKQLACSLRAAEHEPKPDQYTAQTSQKSFAAIVELADRRRLLRQSSPLSDVIFRIEAGDFDCWPESIEFLALEGLQEARAVREVDAK